MQKPHKSINHISTLLMQLQLSIETNASVIINRINKIPKTKFEPISVEITQAKTLIPSTYPMQLKLST